MKKSASISPFLKSAYSLFGMLFLVCILSVSSCRKDPPPPPAPDCNLKGTIEMVPCASGAWGNLWIRTSDGKLIKPCQCLVPGFTPADGMKVLYSVAAPAKTSNCVEIADPENICVRYPEYHALQVVTCIKALPGVDNKCSVPVTVRDMTGLDGCRWIFELADGSKLEPRDLPAGFKLYDGQKLKIGYVEEALPSFCMMGKTVHIKCIEEVKQSGNCNTFATVRDMTGLDGCGWVFELDNGSRMEPFGIPAGFPLHNGQRVKFGYTELNHVSTICMNGTPVHITCIENVASVACKAIKHTSNPKQVNKGFSIKKAMASGSCLEITVGFSGCSDQYRRFELNWDGNSNHGNATSWFHVLLSDEGQPEFCQAYFTRTYSFDIAPLKQKAGMNRVAVKIEGVDDLVYFE